MKTGLILLLLMAAPLVAAADGTAIPRDFVILSQVADNNMHHAGMQAHWTAPKEAAERQNPVPANRASLLRGNELYRRYCAACHGASGKGDGPAGTALTPKPANLREMAKMHSAGDLAWKITHGRGPMPSWKGVLTEPQIWDVVNYIQSLGRARKGAWEGKE